MKEKEKNFLAFKDIVIDNLNILRANLITCTDQLGMEDPDNEFYNKIIDLIEDVNSIELFEELNEIISRAQDIEKTIDLFLAKEGQNTLGLSWPDISVS